MFQARVPGTKARRFCAGALGFVQDGRLFIAGRYKDLIIIRGKNHYPHDVEATSQEAVSAAGAVAAFMIEDQAEERLVIVQELASRERPEALARDIYHAVLEQHEIEAHTIVLATGHSQNIQRQGAKKAPAGSNFSPANCMRSHNGGALRNKKLRCRPWPLPNFPRHWKQCCSG